MADKSFGVKELNLLNASGTPTVTSPNNLNLNANTVAISTSATVGNNLTVTSTTNSANLNVTGVGTLTRAFATDLSVSGVTTITVPANANPHSSWDVVNNSSSAYRFTGPGQDGAEDNPDIYLVRGQRYVFKMNASGHPFQIRVANGGAAYSDGVTNNGAQTGNVVFNVQHDAPARLYYQCTSHGGMVGNIYIIGGQQVISGILTVSSSTQYGGYKLDNGSSTVAELVGFASDNDEGGLALWDGGSKKVEIKSNGNSFLTGGNLGIGIQSPARELHLHSPDSGSTYLALTNTTSGSGVNDGFQIGLGGDEVARIWNYENTNLEIGVNNGKRFEINTVGVITQYSTGSFQIAKGNTSERPNPAQVGMLRFNTQTDQLENYNATSGWKNVSDQTPNITSITGDIYAGMATNLTINVTNATSTVTVIFKEGSTTKATLTNQSVSSNSLTVAVPSAVYGESAGDTITITVTNDTNVVSAGSDKTIQTSPSGGTITTSGNFRIHTFTSSGNFVNTVANLGVEYLIIAGGGGGGSAGSGVAGGGGGAGGYRSNVSGQSSGGGNSAESAMTLSAATYAVVVGAGAAKPTNNADQGGVRGSNSSFNSIVSIGGGGGGGNGADAAQGTGGSGGGGKESDGAGSAGTSGQGYAGGNGSEGGNAGGGGGGAGEAGNTDGFAHGGDGVSSNITGSAVVRGGGGSSGNTSGLQPAGGDGGGAQASNNNQVDGGDGTANTGGGGGGGYSVGGKGGAGGSGIVIVRYNTTTI